MENLSHLYISKIPSSAKIKQNQIQNNISFQDKPKSQGKRKTCKEKSIDDINIHVNKKLIPMSPSNNKYISKENNFHINNNYSNIDYTKYEIINNNKIPTDNYIKLRLKMVKNQINTQNLYQNNNSNNYNNYFNKSRNELKKNINIKQFNTELYEEKCKSCKDKNIKEVNDKNPKIFLMNNEIHQNAKYKIPFIHYKKNINICRSKKIMNNNYSLDGNNNNFSHNTFKDKSHDYSATLKSENQNNIHNNNLTTTKINGKTKKIYNEELIKSNELNNINECISLEKIKSKLKNFSQTSNYFYQKPKINNGKLKIKEKSNLNISKSNIKTSHVKNVYLKNNKSQTKYINNNGNYRNMDSNYFYNDNTYNIENNNYNNFNNDNYFNDINLNTDLSNINNYSQTKREVRINTLDAKIKTNQFLENSVIKNMTPIFTPKFHNINNLDDINNENNNINNIPNIIVNDNKNIFIQNNYIEQKLNVTDNIDKNNIDETNPDKKNYSYDLNKKNKNNIIKNLKGNCISRKKGITSDKIKTYDLKSFLLDNKKPIDEKKQLNESKNTHIQNDKIVEKSIKNEEKEETLYEESIIVNDSEVYGTLTLKNTINNNNNKDNEVNKDNGNNKDNNINNVNKDNENNNDNKEKNIQDIQNNNKDIKDNKENKENNKNNNENNNNNISIINTYNNNNFRETITINYGDNTDNENQNNKIKIEDILKDKNLLQKKINENINNMNQKNNITYFNYYYSKSNAGKNYGVKKTNQDMPVTLININGIKGFNIFGVLDGHGVNGHYVSKFASDYLVHEIINNTEISKIKQLDKIYQLLKKSNYELLINIFLKTDLILGKQNFDVNFSGTTCVLVIQIGNHLICTNVGDSRAILIYDKYNDDNLKKAEIFELSHDCKPDLPNEKERILKLGGTVDQMLDINGMRGGPQRVWAKNKNFPGLAMSRSLGDYQGKKCGIIPIPEIIEYKLDENSKYCVICSDGVWEFLSNKNVMEIGNEYYLKKDIIGFTHKLIQVSENLWEKKDVIVDDITAVIIFF